MNNSRLRISIVLSAIILALSAWASAGGLLIDGLYRDNEFIKAVWIGNDIITLLIAIPAIIIAMILTIRGSLKARLIWMGGLWYMVYNYIFYMYGAFFNKFFLLYVLVFTLSVYAFILLIIDLDKEELSKKISHKTPVKWISGFMIFFALFIGILWVAQALSYVFTDEIPIGITQTDHPTGVVFATDLSLLVSTLIVGAILLWKNNVWGYVISIITMTKCMLYPLVLLIGGILAYQKTNTWDDLLPGYMVLWIGCIVAFFFLIRGIDKPS